MKGSCRDNQIHFTIKRDSKQSTACVAPFSWGDIKLDEFESTHNKQIDYAKLLRSVAFNCLRFASEYEMKDLDLEYCPELFTHQRELVQFEKMNREHEFEFYDDVLQGMACCHTVESIFKTYYDMEIDFQQVYFDCCSQCNSTDLDNPDIFECNIYSNDTEDQTVMYIVQVVMYLPEENADFGIIVGIAVFDKEGERKIYASQFMEERRIYK